MTTEINKQPEDYVESMDGSVCIYYGDCPYNCECEEDEPWAKCRHRKTQNVRHELRENGE